MKDLQGILGFLLLIISGVFLDTPFISLLAIPLFLTGFVLILVFYLHEIKDSQKWLSTFLIITGALIFWIVSGYSAVTYNQYQGYLSRNPEIQWNWNNIMLVVALNILASILIYVGIKIVKNYKPIELNLLVLPTVLVIPIILFIIKMLVLSGSWFGASI